MVIEVKAGSKDGKFKVMVDGIQEGCEYPSEEVANIYADRTRKKYLG